MFDTIPTRIDVAEAYQKAAEAYENAATAAEDKGFFVDNTQDTYLKKAAQLYVKEAKQWEAFADELVGNYRDPEE